MDPRTLEALQASIAHWERNVAAVEPHEVSTGPGSCALCRMFFWEKDVCQGCPVATHPDNTGCRGTPYSDAFKAWGLWLRQKAPRQEFRIAAQAELDFLKSLLPKDTAP
jgi:hypothetical protein